MPKIGVGQPLGGTIEAGEIASNAVTTAKIADDAVTAAKIAQGTSAQVLMSNATPDTAWTSITGDISLTAAGATTVTDLTITGEVQGDILYFNGTNWVRLAAGTSGQFLKTLGAAANPAWDTVTAGKVLNLAGSTITLATTTTAYDTNFLDISIAAGDLAATDMIVIEYGVDGAGDQAVSVRLDTKNVTLAENLAEKTYTAGTSFWGIIKIFQDVSQNDELIIRHSTLDGSTETHQMVRGNTNDANIFTTAFDLRLNTKFGVASSAAENFRVLAYAIKK